MACLTVICTGFTCRKLATALKKSQFWLISQLTGSRILLYFVARRLYSGEEPF